MITRLLQVYQGYESTKDITPTKYMQPPNGDSEIRDNVMINQCMQVYQGSLRNTNTNVMMIRVVQIYQGY